MSRTARTAAALLILAAALAGLVALLMPSPAAHAAQEPAPATWQADTAAEPADAFLAALAPATDLSPAQAAALTEAADRVCEGLTAQVDLLTMQNALTAAPLPGLNGPLTDEEARHLVNTAAVVHCTA